MKYMWDEEMTKKINKLYESMPNQIRVIIYVRGDNITY